VPSVSQKGSSDSGEGGGVDDDGVALGPQAGSPLLAKSGKAMPASPLPGTHAEQPGGDGSERAAGTSSSSSSLVGRLLGADPAQVCGVWCVVCGEGSMPPLG
jgi:hypothetical protein